MHAHRHHWDERRRISVGLDRRLDPRIAVVAPSAFITALPMRRANRIFEDPDSDPEQDPPRLVSAGVDHVGLLLAAYPRKRLHAIPTPRPTSCRPTGF